MTEFLAFIHPSEVDRMAVSDFFGPGLATSDTIMRPKTIYLFLLKGFHH